MKPIKTQQEAESYLKCLLADFEALECGEWVPDEDSCLASIEVTQALIKFVQGLEI
jgi:hypothetical protein